MSPVQFRRTVGRSSLGPCERTCVLYLDFIISVPEFAIIEPCLLNELEEFLSTF